MKMYTNSEQTAKLIELGFEKPKSEVRSEGGIFSSDARKAYGVGELIEMLPMAIDYEIWWGDEKGEIGTWGLQIDTGGTDYMWSITYQRSHSAPLGIVGAGKELIDALYYMLVELKEEGVI